MSYVGALPFITMRTYIDQYQCDDLVTCVERPLPFKIPIHDYSFVCSPENTNLIIGQAEYGHVVDNFLQYPLIGTSEVSVTQMNGS